MMVIWAMIRTLLGMKLRTMELKRMEKAVTAVTASAITMAVSSLLVTARAEQIPSTCNMIGLLLSSGSSSTRLASFLSVISMTSIAQRGEIRTITVRPHPVFEGVLHPVAGQSRPREGIDAVLVAIRRMPLHYLQGKVALTVVELLVEPQRLPARILDFTAQPRGLAVVIVGDALDGIAIRRQRDE